MRMEKEREKVREGEREREKVRGREREREMCLKECVKRWRGNNGEKMAKGIRQRGRELV